MKHTILNNESDRWKLCYSYLRWKLGFDSIWREEDLPKLESFFKYFERCEDNFVLMTKEERESFEYWEKCRKEYSDELLEQRESLNYIDLYSLIESFGYEISSDEDEDGNEIEECQIFEDKPLKSSIELTYPCICVQWIRSDRDRLGTNSICAIDYVELKEFNLCSQSMIS
jgi:hypothetical protein